MGRGHCANVIENKLKMKSKHSKMDEPFIFGGVVSESPDDGA